MPKPALSIKFLGTGFYVPEKIVTNEEYEGKFSLPPGWIERVTGIKERHICSENEACSDLAIRAAKNALSNANISPEQVDLVILASVGPDYSSPPTAAIIQDRIGAKNAASLDIDVACMGYIWGLNLAASLINAGLHKTVLVVASEPTSKAADYEDQETFILLGDGAGAAIMSAAKENSGILASFFKSDGSRWDCATILGGGSRYPKYYENANIGQYLFKMKGKEIFKFAVSAMNEAIDAVTQKAGVRKEDVKLIIPHQANGRLLASAIKRSGLPTEKFFINLNKFGNTSAASTAIALADANAQGLLKSGDYLILVGFGAGLTWGASLIRW